MSNQQWLEITEVLSKLDEASFDLLMAQILQNRGEKLQLQKATEDESEDNQKEVWEEIEEINMKYGSGQGNIANEEIDKIVYGA
jgi:hypothetical protein